MYNFLPAIIWAGVIMWLSAAPSQTLPDFNIISQDKIGHFAVYGLMTLLSSWGLKRYQNQRLTILNLWAAAGVCAIYGGLMEVMQYTFFPGRTFDLVDMLANSIGCALCVLVFRKWLVSR